MNNLSIILLPALPSVIVGVATIVGFTLYVRAQRKFNVALAELHRFDQDNESLVENNAKLHAQVEVLVSELSARSNEITILRERSTDIMSQLTVSQAEIERLNEAAHPAPHPFVVEKGYVDEDTVATNIVQDNAKPRASRKRKAPETTTDHSH
jgi:hypothetical protein